jgi:hypothetical protein
VRRWRAASRLCRPWTKVLRDLQPAQFPGRTGSSRSYRLGSGSACCRSMPPWRILGAAWKPPPNGHFQQWIACLRPQPCSIIYLATCNASDFEVAGLETRVHSEELPLVKTVGGFRRRASRWCAVVFASLPGSTPQHAPRHGLYWAESGQPDCDGKGRSRT